MRILITGGSGLIGGGLARALLERGEHLSVVGRSLDRLADLTVNAGCEGHVWNGELVPGDALAGVDCVVHLAGEPIFGGYPTAARMKRMIDSRVESTRALVDAIAAMPEGDRPKSLLCASAVGYYGDRGDEVLDEQSKPGAGFLADLCVEWERAARDAVEHGLTVANLRFGVVLAREAGALPLMSLPFKLGLGGRIGRGRQYFPWIHVDDALSLLLRVIDASHNGPINLTAPHPVTNEELTEALGRALHRPTLLPVPAFAVKAALREISGELLGSRRVLPIVAQKQLGFAFRFGAIEEALGDLLG